MLSETDYYIAGQMAVVLLAFAIGLIIFKDKLK